MLRPNKTARFWIAVGVAVGAGVGVAMKNIPIGVGAGIALGALMGLISRKRGEEIP
jgi:hypothetical protein